MRVEFRKLISVEEALNRLYKYYEPRPLGFEYVDIKSAHGRILAEDIQARFDVPHFDRAALDGYAVKAVDTTGADEWNPIRLLLIGRVEAGEIPKVDVRKGTAVEIATGAVMPKGSDAVVMVEDTREANGYIEIFSSVAPGDNVYKAGSDIGFGEVVLRRGARLGYREIGILASLGYRKVKVFSKPKVAILSTGNELLKPGSELEYGKIYDVNTYTLSVLVEESGGEPLPLGIVKDKYEELKNAILNALENADLVITSGSTSVGAGDIIYKIFDEIAETQDPGVIVHGLRLKPGKPTIIAVVKGKTVFGLPGYPLSALIAYIKVVDPVLRKLAGRPSREYLKIKAKISFSFRPVRGRVNVVPVSLVKRERDVVAFPIIKGSGAISSLLLADGFIEVPEDILYVEEGSVFDVELFSESLKIPDLHIVGSHCLGLELLLSILYKRGVKSRAISVGSMGGFLAIKRGEADIAGVHMLDPETGVYNKPYFLKLNLKDHAVLVKGYLREQGFIVKKDNPKKIKNFEDLLRDDVVFVNRSKGSGTRALIDLHLKRIAEERGVKFEEIIAKIEGYSVEAKTHTAVAAAIHYGRADVGVGNRAAAQLYNLDFIPIAWEEYDFVIRKEVLESKPVSLFLDVLSSEEFAKLLEEKLVGFRVSKNTGNIVDI